MLLRRACHESDILVAGTLLKCSVVTVSREEQKKLLCRACQEDDLIWVLTFLEKVCSVNCVSSTGDTPLMNAACEGHEEVVKKLILAGANLAMQSDLGQTALLYAAFYNHIQCGILLAKGGASVWDKNKYSKTPLHGCC